MADRYGSDFMTIVDEDGTEFELEVLSQLEYNGCTYLAVIPAGADEDEDLEEGFDFGDEETTIYDVECICGEVINFDEDTLEDGSIPCPNCGENLEFSFEDEDEE